VKRKGGERGTGIKRARPLAMGVAREGMEEEGGTPGQNTVNSKNLRTKEKDRRAPIQGKGEMDALAGGGGTGTVEKDSGRKKRWQTSKRGGTEKKTRF